MPSPTTSKKKFHKVFFAKTEPPGKDLPRILSFKTQKGRGDFVRAFTSAGAKAEAITRVEAQALLGKLIGDGDTRQTTKEGLYLSHAHYSI